MSDLRTERLNILHRVNEAVGTGDLDRANREMDVLLNNIKPALDDGTKEKLDNFLRLLDEEYKKGLAAINRMTESLKPLDRNAARKKHYDRLDQYRTAELYSLLQELVQEQRLVPLGEGG